MKSRVLTCYAWYKAIGLGQRLRRAVLALAARDIGVDWVGITPPDIDHPNVRFHLTGGSGKLRKAVPDHKDRWPWIYYMTAGSCKCLRLARRKEITALMAFSYSAACPLFLAQMITRKPLSIFLRSNEQLENEIKGVSPFMLWVYKHLERVAVKRATTVVPISESLAQIMRERHGSRIKGKLTILYNDIPAPPADLSDCRKRIHDIAGASEGFVVATSGPFNKRKNFSVLIEALAAMKNTSARLVIIGQGELEGSLKARADELGVAARVTFPGWRKDAKELVAGADLFVLPSLAEGVSNSLLEALTADVPCLVSAIPEHIELVGENSDCLFDPESPAKLAETLDRFIDDGEVQKRIQKNCRKAKTLLSFDWDARLAEIVT